MAAAQCSARGVPVGCARNIHHTLRRRCPSVAVPGFHCRHPTVRRRGRQPTVDRRDYHLLRHHDPKEGGGGGCPHVRQRPCALHRVPAGGGGAPRRACKEPYRRRGVAHAASEARNQEIYKENHRFERGHLERQRVFEVSMAEAVAAAGTVLQLSSSSVGSSSSASY